MINPAWDFRLEETKRYLINNSLTVKVGDAVIPLTSASTANIVTNASVAGSTQPLLGVVVGFSGANGEVVGQGQNPSLTPNQYTTLSTNTTGTLAAGTGGVYAVIIPFKKADEVFIIDVNATLGTTSGSNMPNVYFNLLSGSANTLDETSVKVYSDASAPYQVYSLGPVQGQTTQIYGFISRTVYNV